MMQVVCRMEIDIFFWKVALLFGLVLVCVLVEEKVHIPKAEKCGFGDQKPEKFAKPEKLQMAVNSNSKQVAEPEK